MPFPGQEENDGEEQRGGIEEKEEESRRMREERRKWRERGLGRGKGGGEKENDGEEKEMEGGRRRETEMETMRPRVMKRRCSQVGPLHNGPVAQKGTESPPHTSLPRRPFEVVSDQLTKAERKGMITHEPAEEAFALSAEGLHEASVRRIV